MSQEQAIELGAVGLLRWAWRQLTSMRTALILLMLLGVAAIPGSLFPQRNQNPQKVDQYFVSDPTLAHWMDRFKLFDVYASPWFSAIYLLLFISLIGCVIPRTITHLRTIFKKPPLTPKFLNRMECFTTLAPTPHSLSVAEKWFKKNHYRIRVEKNSISAEKGYSRETGNLLFHLSLILILIGVALGSLFGMKGEAILNVGDRFVNTPTSYDTLTFGKFQKQGSLIPFELTATNFVAKYNPLTSAPVDYTLTSSVANPIGSQPKSIIIKVNKPLTYGSTKIYLQANGYSPVVTVRDKSGKVVFNGPTIFLPQDANLTSVGAIKIPDMTPQIGFIGTFLPTFGMNMKRGGFSTYPEALNPELLLSSWKGNLGLDSGVPQSVYQLNTGKMKEIGIKALQLGNTYDFGEGTITFNGWKDWVNLQIVQDPGKMYALFGAIFAILGLLASLFTRQRRIWVKLGDDLEVAGLAKNGIPGLAGEIEELVAHLQASKKEGATE